jgi:hypothetical protein
MSQISVIQGFQKLPALLDFPANQMIVESSRGMRQFTSPYLQLNFLILNDETQFNPTIQ